MSLTLILIRHAKSDWEDPLQVDHDRPLNDRGRRAAPKIGGWLRAEGFVPQTVICSTARRTQETCSGIKSRFNDPPEIRFTQTLYHADASTILAQTHTAEGTALAIIGHNPGIGSLAWSLCDRPPAHPKFESYPTGACLVLGFDVQSWDQVTAGQGRVLGFVTPRDL
ncbi:histidine phosphatase family protein [Rhodophyticola sp. CCM32]|uniref:SixA phosphatase family protein n=1 Tax=Rhodophyticola sp. CCM32 TaxID=2916397 RepID=UPI00107F65CF|nr:histidine phosphatase family protein [Rhodophyticola sp. CCM32]QBY02385.1 histidine phosphatase family protein [Rhodophyticola sp. CCM32]